MKRVLMVLFALALACIVAAVSVAPVAMAEDAFYTVEAGQQVTFSYYYFGTQATFNLPYGYSFAYTGSTKYNNGTEYAVVRYAGFEGYIAKAQLDSMRVAATNSPLPQVTVVVDGLTAYRFADNIRQAFDLQSTDTLYYLGTYNAGDIDYYAVYSASNSDDIFYVVQSHTNRTEIEATLHPSTDNGEDNKDKTIDSQPPAETKSGFTWMRFALILGIVVPLITIVIMVVRPRRMRRSAPRREINEEEDDYDGIDEV